MSAFHLPHTFFDPASRYNRFRSAADPRAKLLDYFDRLAHPRQRLAAHSTPSDMVACPGPLVIRLDDVETPVEAEVEFPRADILASRYVVLFQLPKVDCPKREVPCRVLLLEPEMLDCLRETLAAEGRRLPRDDQRAIRMVLTEDILENSVGAARILAAVPDLDGRVQPDGQGSAEEKLPFGCPNAPRQTMILVVYDRPPFREGE